MARPGLVSLAAHLIVAAPFAVRIALPAAEKTPPAPVMAQVELIEQDTPAVGSAPPAARKADRTAAAPKTAPEPPSVPGGQQVSARPSAPMPQSDAEAAIRLGDGGDFGTGLVSGAAVIPAGLDAKIHNRPPGYPAEAARLGEAGVVVLVVHVAPDGAASGVDVRQSSGFARLDEAARAAVARWHFRPGIEDGVPVASLMEVEVNFELKGEK